MAQGHFYDLQNEGDAIPRRKEQVLEEEMYSTDQVIQITELMATVAYAEGFQEAANLDDSNPKEKSRLVSQVSSTREMTLGYANKFVPSEIRKGISLPIGKPKNS